MADSTRQPAPSSRRVRYKLLLRIEHALEIPMIVLSLVWLVLLILDFTRGLGPFLQGLSDVIWLAFILQFVVEIVVAPRKIDYLKHNALTVVSLAVPALRIFRIARAIRLLNVARSVRGIRLVRVVTSLNRGMRAVGMATRRHGFAYVATLTLLVVLAGAAGMYAFERNPGGGGLNSYGDALWWTAMLITTVGSEYWPRTAEGRILCLLLSFYALGVLGYITATLASFFVGRDAESDKAPVAGDRAVRRLQAEIEALRAEIAAARKGER